MADICDRLRNWGYRSARENHDDAREAADEIEALRIAVEQSRRDGIKTGLEMADTYLALAGNIDDAKSMIKVAIATVEDT